jgi:hypothetical protein
MLKVLLRTPAAAAARYGGCAGLPEELVMGIITTIVAGLAAGPPASAHRAYR